jgi:DNA-binding NtrC family response regulator
MQNAATQLPPPEAKPIVLFVDDEPRVLTSMRAMFRRTYQVRTAPGALEALAIMAAEPVEVVVSDQRMPGMSGVEFLGQLKTEYPNCMRILLTGYADLEAVESSINNGEVFRYLVKPCPPIELKRVVKLAVAAIRSSTPAQAPTLQAVAPRVADVEFAVETEFPVLTHEIQNIAPEPTPSPAVAAEVQESVDVLVLSRDEALCTDVISAMQGEMVIHTANFLDEALDLLVSQPIGVLVTDLAVNEHEVSLMTRELKQQVPQLITILAAQRSDANMLIDLINQGQVFRFLLKPVPQAQCRIWLRSAVSKHLELVQSPDNLLRHVVDEPEIETTAQSLAPTERQQADTESGTSLLRERGLGLRQLLEQKSAQVTERMGILVDESSRALTAVASSAPAKTLVTHFTSLKQRISQWKASHG